MSTNVGPKWLMGKKKRKANEVVAESLPGKVMCSVWLDGAVDLQLSREAFGDADRKNELVNRYVLLGMLASGDFNVEILRLTKRAP